MNFSILGLMTHKLKYSLYDCPSITHYKNGSDVLANGLWVGVQILKGAYYGDTWKRKDQIYCP